MTMTKTEQDKKEIVHYYTDGGLKKGVAVAAFLRKTYGMPTKEEYRRYPRSKGYTSTDAEIRAIRLAVEDAKANGIEMNKVVIHTDQWSLVFGKFKSSSKLSELRNELDELGINAFILVN